MLQSMGLQRVRRDIMTEQQQQSFDVQLLGLLSEKKKNNNTNHKRLLYTLAPPLLLRNSPSELSERFYPGLKCTK